MARTETEDAPARRRRPWTRLDVGILLLLVLMAGLLRFVDLGDPGRQMFDEVYYAKDACAYVATLQECDLDAPQAEVHPPLGKWLIGGGIQLFGYDSFGWRAAAAAAGAATVALLYALARRLLSSTMAAGLSAGLLTIDFLHIVQSRIAMLDVFVPLFGIAAFFFLVIDRDDVLARLDAGEELPKRILGRPWRAAAGSMAGAAVATKWSGGLVLLAVLVVACTWELSARRRAGASDWLRTTLLEAGPSLVLYLLLLPFLVYVVTYVGRLDGDLLALPWSDGSWFRAFISEQTHMLDFHRGLEATHHYQSPAWSWIALKRPVAYFYEDLGDGTVQEVMAFGSPFVWWSSIAALLFVVYNWTKHRDMHRPEGVILAGFAFNYAPWFVPFIGRDAIFLFYLLPAVPFMCLALGYTLTRIGESWEARAAQALFVAGAVAAFLFFQPLLYKSTISRERWDSRIWFDDKGCERPSGTPTKTTVTELTGGQETTVVKDTLDNSSLPPIGWCWI